MTDSKSSTLSTYLLVNVSAQASGAIEGKIQKLVGLSMVLFLTKRGDLREGVMKLNNSWVIKATTTFPIRRVPSLSGRGPHEQKRLACGGSGRLGFLWWEPLEAEATEQDML